MKELKTYEVRVRLSAYVKVEAHSEDEAREKVDSYDFINDTILRQDIELGSDTYQVEEAYVQ